MAFMYGASGFGALAHAEATETRPAKLGALDVAQRHIQLVSDAKAALTVPVIASMNGTTRAGWLSHAARLADAGADALELNVYRVVADLDATATAVEDAIVELVDALRAKVSIPLAVKIGPYFTALPFFVRRLAAAGAEGLVLFNRFYQPDIDIDELSIRPSLDLSTSADLRLPLRWMALLKGNVDADLALSGGVHEPSDVVKALLAGATVASTTSALLRHGPAHLTHLRDGLVRWLTENDYLSVSQLRGSMAVGSVPDPDAYERANYVRVIQETSRSHGLTIDISNQ
jgi:dihydroorotate dehydrogenase (fumarate)